MLDAKSWGVMKSPDPGNAEDGRGAPRGCAAVLLGLTAAALVAMGGDTGKPPGSCAELGALGTEAPGDGGEPFGDSELAEGIPAKARK